MPRSIPRQVRTPADELRDLLDRSYKTAVNSRGLPADTLHQLLLDLDRIAELLPQLEAQGVDLRPEQTRWEEVQGAVRRHEGDILAGLKPLGGLKSLRDALPQAPDPTARWWWWMDVSRAQRKKRRLLMTIALVVGVILVLVGGVWAFQKLFPADERMVQAYEHKLNAEDFVVQGHLDEAVTELEAARALTPDDPDILSLLAVLYHLQGRKEEARALEDQLFQMYPKGIVLSNLAQSYVAAGEADRALDLALQAIQADPANPQGYLVAAMAYEAQGDVPTAMRYYQDAAEKANAAGDHQTEAFAKVRLANMLQKPRITPPGVTPTP